MDYEKLDYMSRYLSGNCASLNQFMATTSNVLNTAIKEIESLYSNRLIKLKEDFDLKYKDIDKNICTILQYIKNYLPKKIEDKYEIPTFTDISELRNFLNEQITNINCLV